MASCTTTQWANEWAPQAKLTVTISSDTTTSAKLSWTLDVVFHGNAASSSASKSWKVTVGGQSWSGKTTIGGITGTKRVSSGTKTITKTTSSQKISFSCSFSFNLTWGGTYSGTRKASSSITVSAKTSYTVSYNANGGSGAPGKQTKWYGTTLKLSSTKPTRTGYTFQGWGTSTTDTTVDYSPGGSYTKNASDTLYAIWKANTYAVSFDANGGTGAPGSQTKTYGQTLTLSSTIPTRTNYNFLGWGTSAAATTVAYEVGDDYTQNSAITLYAIWELAYIAPSITDFKCYRCDSSGTVSDIDDYVCVSFGWKVDQTISSTNVMESIQILIDDVVKWNSNAGGTTGTVSQIISDITGETTHDILVKLTDTYENGAMTTASGTIATAFYVVDFKAGGNGVAFGRAASEDDLMDVAFKTRFRDTAYIDNGKAYCGTATDGTNLSLAYVNSSDNTVFGYGSYINGIGSTNIYGNTISMTSNNGIIKTDATLQLTRTTDLSGTADNKPALMVGSMTGEHIEMDGNEIHAKDSSSTVGILALNADGGNVTINGCVMAKNAVLWSGALYMLETQTVTLSQSIASQANGVVLIFSRYSDDNYYNEQMCTYFIPKYFPANYSGDGLTVTLNTHWNNGVKYLYITNTTIRGHERNTGTRTVGGITYSNSSFVLRNVIGL